MLVILYQSSCLKKQISFSFCFLGCASTIINVTDSRICCSVSGTSAVRYEPHLLFIFSFVEPKDMVA